MKKVIFITIILLFNGFRLLAQPIITPWGNIKGFFVEGEKMNFETSVRSVKTDLSGCISSERCNWRGLLPMQSADRKSKYSKSYRWKS